MGGRGESGTQPDHTGKYHKCPGMNERQQKRKAS